ncbi:MAG: YdiU family protein [Candidatus Latescibacterota bacterium]|nr:YdiU family protein [Candidatus Latescibacterota bacterium]
MSAEGLAALSFDNRFTRELPADPKEANYCRQVQQACYSRVQPTRVSKPQLVAYAHEVAALLDLAPDACETDEFAEVFAGNCLLEDMDPYAMCYGGHQFGNWAGQLGDGRAINLGEVVNARGERWALQLKGAGLTPYSRLADGLAVLRSSIREFLCSEAMYHLGVPTTRALSLVVTGEEVVRDMFYNGHPQAEPGAVVCRVSPSFTRFGSLQIFAARGELEVLRQLAEYTLRTDFPHLGAPSPEVYLQWFEEVVRRTAEMVAHWMRVGFVHGVMNTDNMSILGLTIDYGPYGWLEGYDLGWTPNTTDAQGRRYRFGNQPQVAHWNLAQLGQAILPLVDEIEPLQEIINGYPREYERYWQAMQTQKLGLEVFDGELTGELHEILQLVETDMTIFYRRLALIDVAAGEEAELMASLMDAYYVPDQLTDDYRARLGAWLRKYCAKAPAGRRERMDAANPKNVLRNYMAQLAIDKAEEGDYGLVRELLDLLRRPYDEQPEREEHAQKRPDWARHRAGCSMLSCSS